MQKHRHGGDIYSRDIEMDYSANISPLGLPETAREAILHCLDSLVHYPDVECRALREKIGEREGVSRDAVLCGNGAAELIFALAHGLKPRRALLTAPGFAEYEQALSGIGCTCTFYDLKEEKEFRFQEDYMDAIRPGTDIVFLCNPNNPTGTVVDREFLLAAAARCRECGAVLVVDECFNDFLDDPEAMTGKPYLKEFPNLVILRAFTKIYAMPGLRLGYCLSENPELLDKMRAVMQPWSVSIPAQAAGAAVLTEEHYVEDVRALIKRERRFLMEELQGLGMKTFPANANYIFFKGPVGLEEEFLKKRVRIRNCGNYRGLAEGYYRIAVKGHEDNARFVKILEEIL